MSSVEFKPRYTIADYEQWSGDWELWQGSAISMTPSPFGRHQQIGSNFVFAFRSALKQANCDRFHVLYELDWQVSNNTVVRPDIVIAAGPVPDRFMQSAPTLIVEILSELTRDKDRTAKRDLYEQEQVRHYLLADPEKNQIEALELTSGRYVSRIVDQSGTLPIRIADDCELSILIEQIFE